jgi:hypothetical protein
MSIPKRQHTVPRVYLENFKESDGRLTVWSKRRKMLLRPEPEGALIRGFYYSQPENGAENANHSIETDFLGGIETRYPQFLQSIVNGNPDFEIDLFLHTVLMIRSRSVAFRECFELGLADMVGNRIKELPKSALPPPPADYPDIMDDVVVTIDPHRSLTAMAFYILNYCTPLTQMEWSVRHTPKGRQLLTSDNPVVWYERGFGSELPIIYPLIIGPQTRAVLPLGRNVALVGKESRTGDLRFIGKGHDLSTGQVNEINAVQIGCAWDEVIGDIRAPKTIVSRFSAVAPRMDIAAYDPETGSYIINAHYLSEMRKKEKFERAST